MGGGQASTEVIEAHLAVQAAIRSYQVRGHLAASIDPLGLNNMDREQAKKMIIRSVTVDAKVGGQSFLLQSLKLILCATLGILSGGSYTFSTC